MRLGKFTVWKLRKCQILCEIILKGYTNAIFIVLEPLNLGYFKNQLSKIAKLA